MSASLLVLLAVLVYLLVGLHVARGFHRRGHRGTAAAALFTWPLLLEGTAPSERGRSEVRRGPYDERIASHLADLAAALCEPGVEGLVSPSDLQAIADALYAADGRIGSVDRLLADPAVAQAEQGDRLVSARRTAAAELESVLRGLVQLRVQLGLVALVGETAPVRDRLRELSARLGAIDEVGLSSRPSPASLDAAPATPTPPSPEESSAAPRPAPG